MSAVRVQITVMRMPAVLTHWEDSIAPVTLDMKEMDLKRYGKEIESKTKCSLGKTSIISPEAGSRTFVVNNTSSLLPFVQEMELAIEPLGISTVRMGPLTWTSNLTTWWSCGQKRHCKGLDNQSPVSKVAFGLLLFFPVQCIAIGYAQIQQPEEYLPPPFQGLPGERVRYTILIGYVNSVHIVIVEMNHRWLLHA